MTSVASIIAERLLPRESRKHNKNSDCPITNLPARLLTLPSSFWISTGSSRQLLQIANLSERDPAPALIRGAPHRPKTFCSLILMLLHLLPSRAWIPTSESASNRKRLSCNNSTNAVSSSLA